MKWTRKKPKIEGRFWYRGYGKPAKIVVVAYHEGLPIDSWRVCDVLPSECGYALSLFREENCEWSDRPIPEPSET